MTSSTSALPPHSARRVVVVHGFGADPGAHWFGWLRGALADDGISVDVPALPDPLDPDPIAWESVVAEALGEPDAGTWVVAHSLGGITTLRVLADLPGSWTLGGLVLVSGFTGRLAALPVLDEYLAADVDVERVAAHVVTRATVRSDDDPLVPPRDSDELGRRIGATLHVQSGAGHFLADDGVTSLPVVRDLVRGADSSATVAGGATP